MVASALARSDALVSSTRAGSPAAALEAILARPDGELDYKRAKLEIDRIVDPSLDSAGAAAEIAGLAAAATGLVDPAGGANARLAAVRRVIHEAGPWNYGRPFAYDHGDPLGQSPRSRLLPVYLATRLGNCVSMPILFLILAERLDLDVALATAPLHVFVRWRDESGGTLNLETTSGAHPARDSWIRQNFPMTDRALANGLYMRSLGRREGVALMAVTLLEHLLDTGRAADAIEVADLILACSPRDGHVLAKKASACALAANRLEEEFGPAFRMPLPPRLRHLELIRRNRALFARAEALGWEPVS